MGGAWVYTDTMSNFGRFPSSATSVHSGAEAERFLAGGRNKDSRTIENNTKIVRLSDGSIAVRLHATDVVTYHLGGTITLNAGGWYTVTTKDRINRYLPRGMAVASVKGRWALYRTNTYPEAHEELTPFYDGMVINAETGALVSETVDTTEQDKANAEVSKAIVYYVKGLTDDKIKELWDHAVANGTAGDCWYCGMFTTHDGKPLADITGTDHLLSHLDEKYYMASLVMNALEAKGYHNPQFVFQMGCRHGRSVRDAVKTYLRKALIQGAVSVR